MPPPDVVRNRALYQALHAYCHDALRLLQAQEQGTGRLADTPAQDAHGQLLELAIYARVSHPAWQRLLWEHHAQLQELPSYYKAAQAMQEDEAAARHLDTVVGTAESRAHADASTYLSSFLIEILAQHGLTFDNTSFDSMYLGLEDYFHSDTAEYRYRAPLYGFSMETNRLELTPNLALVKVSREEQQGMFRQQALSMAAAPFTDMPSIYALETSITARKWFGRGEVSPGEAFPSQQARDRFDQVCLALRLFRRGGVGYRTIEVFGPVWQGQGKGTFGWLTHTGAFRLGGLYVLHGEDLPTFRAFWETYQPAMQAAGKRTGVASRRFEFAYERTRPEDKLIDYLIGFEALLLKSEEKDELAYRLSL